MKTDFFITYGSHSKDEAASRWIGHILQEAGFKFYMNSWSFLPGLTLSEKVHSILNMSEKVILLISDQFLKSEIDISSLKTILFELNKSANSKFLIFRIDSCNVFKEFEDITFTDLFDLPQGEVKNRILISINTDKKIEELKNRFSLTQIKTQEILQIQEERINKILSNSVSSNYHMKLELEKEVEKEILVEVVKIIHSGQEEKKIKTLEKRKQFTWEEISLKTILTDDRHYILINPSGMGKTTFLKYIAKLLIDSNNNQLYRPFFTTCIDLNQRSGTVNDFIQTQIENLYYNTQTQLINQDWSNLCILIDALDQSNNIDDIVSSLLMEKRISNYRNSKIIISSRENTADKVKEGFSKIRLKLPKMDQIKLYLGDEYYEKLKAHIKASADLVTVPVLLEMLKKLVDNGIDASVISSRSELYSKFTKNLINQELNKPRFWQNPAIINYFIENDLEKILEKVSFLSLSENKILEIEKITLNKYCGSQEKTEALLNVGIIIEFIENKEEKVVFRHQSFQAFFAARYIFFHRPDLIDKITFDIRFFYNEMWYEVIRFYIGFEKIPEQAETIINKILMKGSDFSKKIEPFNQARYQKIIIDSDIRLFFSVLLASDATLTEKKVKSLHIQLNNLLRRKKGVYWSFLLSLIDKFNIANDIQRRKIIHIFIQYLKGGDEDFRSYSAEILKSIGTFNDIPLIEQLLWEKKLQIRSSAIEIIGKIGTEENIPLLNPLLRDSDKNVQESAYLAIQKLKVSEITVSHDFHFSEKDDLNFSISTSVAIEKFGIYHTPRSMINILNDQNLYNHALKEKILDELFSYGRISFLESLIEIADAEQIQPYIIALKKIFTSANIHKIYPLTGSWVSNIRRIAVELISENGTSEQIYLLEPLLRDKNVTVRKSAIEAFKKLGSSLYIFLIKPLLKDDYTSIRVAAIETIGNFGTPDYVPDIIDLLKEENYDIRRAAVEALGKLGTTELHPLLRNQLFSLLLSLLKTESKSVHLSIIEALGKIISLEHISSITYLLKDEDYRIRIAALKIIGKFHNPEIIKLLEPLKKDPNKKVRITLVKTIGNIGTPDYFSLIKKFLKDKESEIRCAAIEAFGSIITKEHIHYLETIVTDENWEVRKSIAEVLGKIGSFEYIPILKFLIRDKESTVRHAAIDSLEIVLRNSTPETNFLTLELNQDINTPNFIIAQDRKNPTEPLHILHISDIHNSIQDEEYIKYIFNEFIEDIKKWRKLNQNKPINAICITGDITFSGQLDQYNSIFPTIKTILDVSGCSKNNLFLIPGNHDMEKYDIISPLQKKHLKKAVETDNYIDYKILDNYDHYSSFYNKFKQYYTFINSSGYHNSLTEVERGNPKTWYVRLINGFPVRIIGLNSALFCLKDYSERGKLRIGLKQFMEANKYYNKNHLTILLTHHPLEWLIQKESEEFLNLIKKHSIIQLYGHIHRFNIEWTRSESGNIYMKVGTGSIYGERKSEDQNTYHIMTFDFENQNIHIWARRWVNNFKSWMDYSENCKNVYSFPKKIT